MTEGQTAATSERWFAFEITPKMRRQDRRRRRRLAVRRRLVLLWGRTGYQPWARLLHRLNLHHTRTYGPMEDGLSLVKCEWCGLSKSMVPDWLIEQRMREASRG